MDHVPRLLLVSSVILEIQISVQSTENQTKFIIQSKLTFRSTVRLAKTLLNRFSAPGLTALFEWYIILLHKRSIDIDDLNFNGKSTRDPQ